MKEGVGLGRTTQLLGLKPLLLLLHVDCTFKSGANT